VVQTVDLDMLFDTIIRLEAHVFADFPVLLPDTRELARSGDLFGETASTTTQSAQIDVISYATG